jgi:hypothetical protein
MYFLSSQSVRRTFNTLGIAFCVSIILLVIIGVIPFSVLRRSSAQQSRVIVSVATMPQAQLSGWYGPEENEIGLGYRWGGTAPHIPLHLPDFYAEWFVLSMDAASFSPLQLTMSINERVQTPFSLQAGLFRRYHVLGRLSPWNDSLFHRLSFYTPAPPIINGQPHSVALAELRIVATQSVGYHTPWPSLDSPAEVRSLLLFVGCLLVGLLLCALVSAWQAVPRFVLAYCAGCLVYWQPLFVGTLVASVLILLTPAVWLGMRQRLKSPLWVGMLVLGFCVALSFGRVLADQGSDLCRHLNVACEPINADARFGDEPRYVALAQSLYERGTAQSVPSTDTLKNGYSMHSIGIPLIIAIPHEIGGVLIARLTIIALTSSLVLVIYRWKSFLLQSTATKLWLTLGLVCAVPYMGVNGTFYPDLLAGVALLWIGYWLSGLSRSRATIIAATIAVLILPWLHAKYLPIQVCVIGFMLYDLYTRGWQGRGRTPVYIGAVIVLNTMLLLTYHARAWGNVFGPMTHQSIVFSGENLRYVAGLLLDQNQGLFAQHPLLLFGVYGMARLYHSSRRLFLYVLVTGGVPLLINGLHWNSYGGFSYSGRFASTTAVVFLIPALYGLSRIAPKIRTGWTTLMRLSIVLQLWFMYTITVQTVPYQREASPTKPLTDYSIWYDPFAQWMGLFVQTMNPWFHAANYAWVALIIAVGYAGYRTERDQRLRQLGDG